MSSPELDLSQPSDVLQYLAGTPFSSSRVEILSGGNANFIFRLFLDDPAVAGAPTAVLKHAKPWSRSNSSFALAIGRQEIEAFALQRVRPVLNESTPDSIVTVPKVFLHDSNAYIIIMEDAGENSEPLKALLRRTSLPAGNLDHLCTDLGRFLATIHNRGSSDSVLMEKVNQNIQMRGITSWITYDRLLPILRGEGRYDGLLSPSLVGPDGLSDADLERIQALCSQRSAEIHSAQDVFTMGDFWTGNIICRVDAQSGAVDKALVVDWEVTKPGVPFLDFGQLAAELHTITHFHPERSAEIAEGLSVYGKAYTAARETAMDETFVAGAASHMGAHMAVITPTVDGWGTKEQVRGVVEEGTRYILKGIDGDREWFGASVVGGLMG